MKKRPAGRYKSTDAGSKGMWSVAQFFRLPYSSPMYSRHWQFTITTRRIEVRATNRTEMDICECRARSCVGMMHRSKRPLIPPPVEALVSTSSSSVASCRHIDTSRTNDARFHTAMGGSKFVSGKRSMVSAVRSTGPSRLQEPLQP